MSKLGVRSKRFIFEIVLFLSLINIFFSSVLFSKIHFGL